MWLLLPLLLGTPAWAGPKAEVKAAERADPFSRTNLDADLADLVKRVETAAGREFLTPPVVELASDEVFQKMLAEEQALIASAVYRDTPDDVRQRMSAGGGQAVYGGLLGKYGIFEKKLYLCDAAITQATLSAGLPTHRIRDVSRVILAHELTHALHDQHVDLAQMVRGLPDQDALWAAEGTWEGLATWVSERVAADLGLTDLWVTLAGWQGWGPDGLEEPLAWQTWAVYGRGRGAIAWHHEHGGFDEVWAVAAAPPTRSSAVFRPDTWPAPRPVPALDYAAVLRGTEQALTRGDWWVGITVLGEMELRGEAVIGGNEPGLDEALAHLQEAWTLHAERPDRVGQVRVLQFDDPAWARRYLELLREQQTTEAKLTAAAIGQEIEVRTEPFTQVTGDDAVLRVSRVAGAGGTSTEKHAAWVVRGATAVVVSAERFRPGLRLGWTVDAVYRRLDAARAGQPLPEVLDRP